MSTKRRIIQFISSITVAAFLVNTVAMDYAFALAPQVGFTRDDVRMKMDVRYAFAKADEIRRALSRCLDMAAINTIASRPDFGSVFKGVPFDITDDRAIFHIPGGVILTYYRQGEKPPAEPKGHIELYDENTGRAVRCRLIYPAGLPAAASEPGPYKSLARGKATAADVKDIEDYIENLKNAFAVVTLNMDMLKAYSEMAKIDTNGLKEFKDFYDASKTLAARNNTYCEARDMTPKDYALIIDAAVIYMKKLQTIFEDVGNSSLVTQAGIDKLRPEAKPGQKTSGEIAAMLKKSSEGGINVIAERLRALEDIPDVDLNMDPELLKARIAPDGRSGMLGGEEPGVGSIAKGASHESLATNHEPLTTNHGTNGLMAEIRLDSSDVTRIEEAIKHDDHLVPAGRVFTCALDGRLVYMLGRMSSREASSDLFLGSKNDEASILIALPALDNTTDSWFFVSKEWAFDKQAQDPSVSALDAALKELRSAIDDKDAVRAARALEAVSGEVDKVSKEEGVLLAAARKAMTSRKLIGAKNIPAVEEAIVKAHRQLREPLVAIADKFRRLIGSGRLIGLSKTIDVGPKRLKPMWDMVEFTTAYNQLILKTTSGEIASFDDFFKFFRERLWPLIGGTVKGRDAFREDMRRRLASLTDLQISRLSNAISLESARMTARAANYSKENIIAESDGLINSATIGKPKPAAGETKYILNVTKSEIDRMADHLYHIKNTQLKIFSEALFKEVKALEIEDVRQNAAVFYADISRRVEDIPAAATLKNAADAYRQIYSAGISSARPESYAGVYETFNNIEWLGHHAYQTLLVSYIKAAVPGISDADACEVARHSMQAVVARENAASAQPALDSAAAYLVEKHVIPGDIDEVYFSALLVLWDMVGLNISKDIAANACGIKDSDIPLLAAGQMVVADGKQVTLPYFIYHGTEDAGAASKEAVDEEAQLKQMYSSLVSESNALGWLYLAPAGKAEMIFADKSTSAEWAHINIERLTGRDYSKGAGVFMVQQSSVNRLPVPSELYNYIEAVKELRSAGIDVPIGLLVLGPDARGNRRFYPAALTMDPDVSMDDLEKRIFAVEKAFRDVDIDFNNYDIIHKLNNTADKRSMSDKAADAYAAYFRRFLEGYFEGRADLVEDGLQQFSGMIAAYLRERERASLPEVDLPISTNLNGVFRRYMNIIFGQLLIVRDLVETGYLRQADVSLSDEWGPIGNIPVRADLASVNRAGTILGKGITLDERTSMRLGVLAEEWGRWPDAGLDAIRPLAAALLSPEIDDGTFDVVYAQINTNADAVWEKVSAYISHRPEQGAERLDMALSAYIADRITKNSAHKLIMSELSRRGAALAGINLCPAGQAETVFHMLADGSVMTEPDIFNDFWRRVAHDFRNKTGLAIARPVMRGDGSTGSVEDEGAVPAGDWASREGDTFLRIAAARIVAAKNLYTQKKMASDPDNGAKIAILEKASSALAFFRKENEELVFSRLMSALAGNPMPDAEAIDLTDVRAAVAAYREILLAREYKRRALETLPVVKRLEEEVMAAPARKLEEIRDKIAEYERLAEDSGNTELAGAVKELDGYLNIRIEDITEALPDTLQAARASLEKWKTSVKAHADLTALNDFVEKEDPVPADIMAKLFSEDMTKLIREAHVALAGQRGALQKKAEEDERVKKEVAYKAALEFFDSTLKRVEAAASIEGINQAINSLFKHLDTTPDIIGLLDKSLWNRLEIVGEQRQKEIERAAMKPAAAPAPQPSPEAPRPNGRPRDMAAIRGPDRIIDDIDACELPDGFPALIRLMVELARAYPQEAGPELRILSGDTDICIADTALALLNMIERKIPVRALGPGDEVGEEEEAVYGERGLVYRLTEGKRRSQERFEAHLVKLIRADHEKNLSGLAAIFNSGKIKNYFARQAIIKAVRDAALADKKVLEDPNVAAIIRLGLDDKFCLTRTSSAKAAGLLGLTQVSARLKEMTLDAERHTQTRQRAMIALGMLGDKDQEEKIVTFLRNPLREETFVSSYDRIWAHCALVVLGHPDECREIASFLSGDSEQIRGGQTAWYHYLEARDAKQLLVSKGLWALHDKKEELVEVERRARTDRAARTPLFVGNQLNLNSPLANMLDIKDNVFGVSPSEASLIVQKRVRGKRLTSGDIIDILGQETYDLNKESLYFPEEARGLAEGTNDEPRMTSDGKNGLMSEPANDDAARKESNLIIKSLFALGEKLINAETTFTITAPVLGHVWAELVNQGKMPISFLEARLSDPDELVCAAAITALGEVYAASVNRGEGVSLTALEAKLSSPTVGTNAAAALGHVYAALVNQGKMSQASLEVKLNDSSENVCIAAITALGDVYAALIKQGKEVSLAPLEAKFTDSGMLVRDYAGYAVGHAHAALVNQGQMSQSFLEAKLNEPNEEPIQFSPGKTSFASILAAFSEVKFDDFGETVRIAAAAALGEVYAASVNRGEEVPLTVLEARFTDNSHPIVGNAAGYALGLVYAALVKQGKMSLASVEKKLVDPEVPVCIAAATALGPSYAAVVNQGKISGEDCKKYVLWSAMGFPYNEAILDKYLASPDPQAYINSMKQKAEAAVRDGFDYNKPQEVFLAFAGVKINGIRVSFEEFKEHVKRLSRFNWTHPGSFARLFTKASGLPELEVTAQEVRRVHTEKVDAAALDDNLGKLRYIKQRIDSFGWLKDFPDHGLFSARNMRNLYHQFKRREAMKNGSLNEGDKFRVEFPDSEAKMRREMSGNKIVYEILFGLACRRLGEPDRQKYITLMRDLIIADALSDDALLSQMGAPDVETRSTAFKNFYEDYTNHLPDAVGYKMDQRLRKELEGLSEEVYKELAKITIVATKGVDTYRLIPQGFLSVFRGRAGILDCSFDEDKGVPYTRAMHEDTIYYFVYSGKQLKGYIGLMVAKTADGRQVLTVDTINSLSLDGEELLTNLFIALNGLAAQLGCIGVALPADMRESFNFGNKTTIEKMDVYKNGGPLEGVTPRTGATWKNFTAMFSGDKYNSIEKGKFKLLALPAAAPPIGQEGIQVAAVPPDRRVNVPEEQPGGGPGVMAEGALPAQPDLKTLLEGARRHGYCVPAFVGAFKDVDPRMLISAIIEASMENNSPVIILGYPDGMTESGLNPASFKDLVEEVKVQLKPQIPVFIGLDHGNPEKSGKLNEREMISEAIDAGFDIVTADGRWQKVPGMAKEEALEEVTKVVAEAREKGGVLVEGVFGETEAPSDPQEAAEFAKRTGVDCMAISVGTIHGGQADEGTNLDLSVGARIAALTKTPLVVHGGSSLQDGDLEQLGKNAIAKVNIGTVLLNTALKAYDASPGDHTAARKDVKQLVLQKIRPLVPQNAIPAGLIAGAASEASGVPSERSESRGAAPLARSTQTRPEILLGEGYARIGKIWFLHRDVPEGGIVVKEEDLPRREGDIVIRLNGLALRDDTFTVRVYSNATISMILTLQKLQDDLGIEEFGKLRFLDAGAGDTGILGIVAAALGAKNVISIENDSEYAKQPALLYSKSAMGNINNQNAPNITFEAGDYKDGSFWEKRQGEIDVVMINMPQLGVPDVVYISRYLAGIKYLMLAGIGIDRRDYWSDYINATDPDGELMRSMNGILQYANSTIRILDGCGQKYGGWPALVYKIEKEAIASTIAGAASKASGVPQSPERSEGSEQSESRGAAQGAVGLMKDGRAAGAVEGRAGSAEKDIHKANMELHKLANITNRTQILIDEKSIPMEMNSMIAPLNRIWQKAQPNDAAEHIRILPQDQIKKLADEYTVVVTEDDAFSKTLPQTTKAVVIDAKGSNFIQLEGIIAASRAWLYNDLDAVRKLYPMSTNGQRPPEPLSIDGRIIHIILPDAVQLNIDGEFDKLKRDMVEYLQEAA